MLGNPLGVFVFGKPPIAHQAEKPAHAPVLLQKQPGRQRGIHPAREPDQHPLAHLQWVQQEVQSCEQAFFSSSGSSRPVLV